MISVKNRLKAVYNDYTKFIKAIDKLSGFVDLDIEVFSPMPLHEVFELLPQKPSGVRWFTFSGAILGIIIGFAFPIYTVLDWPLITGGKPLVTVQAFIIIAFELMILFGAGFTLLGLLFHAKLPRQSLANYDPKFSENSFGMIIKADDDELEKLRPIFSEADDVVVDTVEVDV
ncbi:DUF3341 domain-containing protein [candidate division KSB1 bacterium]|nr:DUF3341 domain-containing protein [candidate division KSB1 bacterium]